MVAVLRGYGKDTAAEVGIAYGMGIPVVGVDFDADPKDVMIYNALTEIVKIEQLPHVLSKIVAHLRQDRDGTRVSLICMNNLLKALLGFLVRILSNLVLAERLGF